MLTEQPAVTIALAVLLAFLAETMTEYLARPLIRAANRYLSARLQRPVTLDLRYIAALVGVALAFAYALDLVALLGRPAGLPWVGQLLTGLIIGRGSNYLNDALTYLTSR